MNEILKTRKIITIDCRELEPPEPFVKVMEAVNRLSLDEAVLMIHRKQPRLLFPKLEELGMKYELTDKGESGIEILIWRSE